MSVNLPLMGITANEAFAWLILYLESLKYTVTLEDDCFALSFEHHSFDESSNETSHIFVTAVLYSSSEDSFLAEFDFEGGTM